MPHRQMLRIVLGYAILSGLYILFSDTLLYTLAPDLSRLSSVSILKGLGFVACTSLTLYVLLRRLKLEEGQRYQSLVEQHQAMMLLIDPLDGNILDANLAAAQFYGYSLPELRKTHISTLNRLPQAEIKAIMAKMMAHEQSVLHLTHWLASDEPRDVAVRNGPVTHLGRQLLLSVIEDETSDKRNQRELERSNRLLALLSDFNQSVVRARDRPGMFQSACNLAVAQGAFTFAWIGTITPEGTVIPVAKAGADGGYIEQIQASLNEGDQRGMGPIGKALRSGKLTVSNTFLKDPDTRIWHNAAAKAGIGSIAVLPIRQSGELIGTFNLYATETDFFGPREQQMLQSVMEDFEYGLSYLVNREALEVTAEVIEASPAVLFRWRNAPGWPVAFVTDNVSNWGYTAASLCSGRILFAQLVHPDDQTRVGDEVAGFLHEQVVRYEQTYRLLTADQRVRWVFDQTSVSYDKNGTPELLQGVLTDITDRKEAEETIQQYVSRLEQAVLGTTLAVSHLVELRDPYTAGHERRVGDLAAAIAAELGYDAHMQQGLQIAGALHDVGKIMVPVEILSKPGKLTAWEHSLIKLHPEEGYKVLKDVPFPWPVAEVAMQHHERLDGSGYPQGLKGDQITLEARIIAIADVVESMSSHRPYRASRGLDLALAEIEQGAGSLYDAAAVAACLELFRHKGYVMETADFAMSESVDR
jgi:PAS domain S-box-containing protein